MVFYLEDIGFSSPLPYLFCCAVSVSLWQLGMGHSSPLPASLVQLGKIELSLTPLDCSFVLKHWTKPSICPFGLLVDNLHVCFCYPLNGWEGCMYPLWDSKSSAFSVQSKLTLVILTGFFKLLVYWLESYLTGIFSEACPSVCCLARTVKMLLERLDWPRGYSLHDSGMIQNSLLFYRTVVILADRVEQGSVNSDLALSCALPFAVQLCGPAWGRNLWEVAGTPSICA